MVSIVFVCCMCLFGSTCSVAVAVAVGCKPRYEQPNPGRYRSVLILVYLYQDTTHTANNRGKQILEEQMSLQKNPFNGGAPPGWAHTHQRPACLEPHTHAGAIAPLQALRNSLQLPLINDHAGVAVAGGEAWMGCMARSQARFVPRPTELTLRHCGRVLQPLHHAPRC